MATKSQFYLSMCVEAASKARINLLMSIQCSEPISDQSPMNFNLGSIIVKGGKVLSSGYNHQRSHYDEAYDNSLATPLSMHSEMHAIFKFTRGKAPSFKQQTMVHCRAGERDGRAFRKLHGVKRRVQCPPGRHAETVAEGLF